MSRYRTAALVATLLLALGAAAGGSVVVKAPLYGRGTAQDPIRVGSLASLETDPQVGTVTAGKWCVADGTAVQCTSAAPVAAESDPQVGLTTLGKWCTADGTQVQCSSDAPVTAESDPQVGTTVLAKWCGANDAGVINCDRDPPVLAEVDPNVSGFFKPDPVGTAGNDKMLTWNGDAGRWSWAAEHGAGDYFREDLSGTPTNSQELTWNGDAGRWTPVSNDPSLPLSIANGGTGYNQTTAGGIAWGYSASSIAYSAAGATGQQLMSNGTSAPTWTNAPRLVRSASNTALPPSTSAGTAIDGLTWSVLTSATTQFDCYLKVTVPGANNGPKVALVFANGTEVTIQVLEFRTTAIAQTVEMLSNVATYSTGITSGLTAGAVSLWHFRGFATAPANGGNPTTAYVYGASSIGSGVDAGLGNGLTVGAGSFCWVW